MKLLSLCYFAVCCVLGEYVGLRIFSFDEMASRQAGKRKSLSRDHSRKALIGYFLSVPTGAGHIQPQVGVLQGMDQGEYCKTDCRQQDHSRNLDHGLRRYWIVFAF